MPRHTKADLSADRNLSRRSFLAATAATTLTATIARGADADATTAQDKTISFFLIGDTHYLADKENPAEIDARSRAVTRGLIDTLNALPGTEIPAEAGGGKVAQPRGVIHAGDLIDTGDKQGKLADAMQPTEWAAFQADFGVRGAADGRLKWPVYEVHGNHDSPHGKGIVLDGIRERNKLRPGVKHISANGLHYSWDWGPVHFVNLGIVVGGGPQTKQPRRYNPLDSLEFLIEDLRANVGTSGRPVIVTHHVDVARYSVPCDAENPMNLNKEWNPCDARSYYEALQRYSVQGILYGHTHVRNIARWDGTPTKSEKGLPLFNVDNSSHFNNDAQAFFYFEINDRELLVRECATKDNWRERHWTPQVWRQPVDG